MRGRLVVLTVALMLGGCSQSEDPYPAVCLEGPETVLTALRQAPGAVALAGGTRLSSCIGSARTEGELQSLGIVLVRVADALRGDAATRTDAALQLGYLAGAVGAGARRSSGSIAAQLARRVDQLASLGPGTAPASAAALARGRAAGERGG